MTIIMVAKAENQYPMLSHSSTTITIEGPDVNDIKSSLLSEPPQPEPQQQEPQAQPPQQQQKDEPSPPNKYERTVSQISRTTSMLSDIGTDLFEIDELELGSRLGEGSFASVFQVRAFCLSETRESNTNNVRQFSPEEIKARQHCQDTASDGRYAIKRLRVQKDKEKARLAVRDLRKEAKLLEHVDHPNIIHMYSCHTTAKVVYECFILMDRLTGTLEDHIENWKTMIQRLNMEKKLYVWDFHNQRFNDRKVRLLKESLRVAHSLASALAYLHQERIVYRDLKPENVGFCLREQVKLFDFGLSRFLPDDDSYRMTGCTGTLLYMAPEVYKKQHYNESVDTYGFAHVLWEMLALEKPYEANSGFMSSQEALVEGVFIRGERPPIKDKWPAAIRALLPRAWAQDPRQRPAMKEVCEIVKGCMDDPQRGGGGGPKKQQPQQRAPNGKKLKNKRATKPSLRRSSFL